MVFLRIFVGIMRSTLPHTLNCNGQLVSLERPQVMGILNVTPDSFYIESRTQTEECIAQRLRQIVAEGATMIDIGACSTRPGSNAPAVDEEMARLRLALPIIKREAPQLILSVDTYRTDVARMCVEEFGADIINDISGGTADRRMFRTVAHLGVPYVLTHIQGMPAAMQDAPHYDDVLREVFLYFAERIEELHSWGVKDIILDPGFGFGKTTAHNFQLMAHIADFKEFDLPLLVGVSRKSMICNTLDCSPQEALNGTTVLNTIALMGGAHILRVHDVRPAMEAMRLVTQTLNTPDVL